MQQFILDASITMVWGFDDEISHYADSLLEQMPTLEAYVPGLWTIEVANSLLVGERRGRIKPADTLNFLNLLGTFPIIIDNETTTRAWTDTINLARTYKLSAYDSTYLELAMRKGLALATIDEKLKSAAASAGVRIFTITKKNKQKSTPK